MSFGLNLLLPGRAQWLGLRRIEGTLYALTALGAVAAFTLAETLLENPHAPMEGGLLGMKPTSLFLARASAVLMFVLASLTSLLDRHFESPYAPADGPKTQEFYEVLLTLSMKPQGTEALEMATRGLGIHGRDPFLRFQRARLLLRSGKKMEAQAELETCRHLDLGHELEWECQQLGQELQETA
ncbi:MAG: hypothetical protein AB7F75_00160 [Planctomycetota bacterium]